MTASRANLRATGWVDGDFTKPVVTVGSPWSNALPCNFHVRDLADEICASLEVHGAKAFVCGTPVISDGMTNGSVSVVKHISTYSCLLCLIVALLIVLPSFYFLKRVDLLTTNLFLCLFVSSSLRFLRFLRFLSFSFVCFFDYSFVFVNYCLGLSKKDGMKYSLISREIIADCIETFHEGYMCDALITIGGCDKSTPAALMPIPRVDGIGVTLYGGTAMPGRCEGCNNGKGGEGLDAGVLMEAIGSYGVGRMSQDELDRLERYALPGSGTCSAMFTANTMSSAIEALGMSVPGTSSRPALASSTQAVDASVKALFVW